jgi:hypothetical protein
MPRSMADSPFTTDEFLDLPLREKADAIMAPTGEIAEWLSGYSIDLWDVQSMDGCQHQYRCRHEDIRELEWLARVLIWSLGCSCFPRGEKKTKAHQKGCAWKRLVVLRPKRMSQLRERESSMEPE